MWLKKGAHGLGYGREAVTSLVNWSKEKLGISKFRYPVDKKNIPSRKIPESLGGIIDREFDSISLSGRKLEQVEYLIK